MAIVAELVRDFGVRVGTVGGRFDQLFRECRGKSWLSLESCGAIIKADSIRLVDAGMAMRSSPDISILCVPCGPIVTRLQSALTATEADVAQGYAARGTSPLPKMARQTASIEQYVANVLEWDALMPLATTCSISSNHTSFAAAVR